MSKFEIPTVPQLPDHSEENAEIAAKEDAIRVKQDTTMSFIEGTTKSYLTAASKQQAYSVQLANVNEKNIIKQDEITTLEYDRQRALETAMVISHKKQQADSDELEAMEREIVQETIADSNTIQAANNLGILDLITSPIDTMTAKSDARDAERNVKANAQTATELSRSRAIMDDRYAKQHDRMAKDAKVRTARMIDADKQKQVLNLTSNLILNKKALGAEQMAHIKDVFGLNDAILTSLDKQLASLGKRRDANVQEVEQVLRQAQLKQNIVNIGMAVEHYNINDKARLHGDSLVAKISKTVPQLLNTDGTPMTLAQVNDLSKNGMLSSDITAAIAFAVKYDGDSNAAILDSKDPYTLANTARKAGGNKMNVSADLLELTALVGELETSKGLTVAGQVQEAVVGGAKANPALLETTKNTILKTIIDETGEGNAKTIYGNQLAKQVAPQNFPEDILAQMPAENAEIIRNLDITPDTRSPQKTVYAIGKSLAKQVADGKINAMRASDTYYTTMQGYLDMAKASSPVAMDKLVFSGLEHTSTELDLTDSIVNHQYFTKLLGQEAKRRLATYNEETGEFKGGFGGLQRGFFK